MKPSERMRNFVLKASSCKFQITCWVVTGIIMTFIGIIMLCIFGINNEIPFTSEQTINGVTTYSTSYIKSFIISLPFLGWGLIIIPIVVVFLNIVVKSLYKGVIDYPVSENKIEKSFLIKKALESQQFSVESNGDWLDFSLNWKDCFSVDAINGSVLKSVAIYKKLVKLNNDYTYQELDYEAFGDINLSLMKFSFTKQMQLGHIRHHYIEYNLGKDNNTENIGINKYTLNTLDFTNEIHKWLAENGYKEIGR